MLIFKDIISGDELATDTFKEVRFESESLNDVFIRLSAKIVTRSETGDYNTGGNPSQEEENEQVEDGSITGLDVILDNRLVEVPYEKKAYQKHLKAYIKKVCEKLKEKYEEGKDLEKTFGSMFGSSWEEAEPKVQQAHTEGAKEILSKFKDLQFFTGESMNTDAMTVLVWYCDDSGVKAHVYLWRHGVEEEKV